MPDALARHVTPGKTPQTEQARPDQVKNNAGGYTFEVSDATALNRFLTLGTEGGTYYATEGKLTRDNAKLVTRMAEASDHRLIDAAVEISHSGRAPRNNPALFAMAAAAGLGGTPYRKRALDLLPRVARTGTHFLTFTEYAEMFRGWGPQLVKGMREWYLGQEPSKLAYQLLKYKQREGWSHRDVLRLCMRKTGGSSIDAEHHALFEYVMKGELDTDRVPVLVAYAEQAHKTSDVKQWVRLIGYTRDLSWEMLPSEALTEPAVWRALIEGGNLPLGALLRNLSRLTRLGLLKQMDAWTTALLTRLTNADEIRKARIHPIGVLIAMKTYGLGHGLKGHSYWTPVPQVMDALDSMFYLAFQNVEPSGKRTLIGVDTSGSMDWAIDGYAFTAREVAGALAMVTMKHEPQWAVMGFGHQFTPLNISANSRLDDVMRHMSSVWSGGTDCSLPMLWAQQNNIAVDTFQVITDNETWTGQMHPHEALKQYRRATGIDARLQVVAVSPTDFSIADPQDPRQLDVSGFDSAVPALLADHSRGDL